MRIKLLSLKKTQLFPLLHKKTFKKHLFTFIITSCLISTAQADNKLATMNSFDETVKEWVLLKNVSGIKVYYKISKCESQNNLIDPIKMAENHLNSHETFGLKFVNENSTSKSISFSKSATTNDTDEMRTISISSGTTIIDSCESSAKLILTRKTGDKYPTSVSEYLQKFKLTVNN